jgi:hypothetical protein
MHYGKAFNSVLRQILFDILKSRNNSDSLLKAKVDTHIQNKMSIKFNSKLSELAEINGGVAKVTLSHLLSLTCT